MLTSSGRWLRARWADLAAGMAIWVTVALITQRWAGLDTPDSSFYASLGIYGSEVSDRAYDNSYFWTRLGEILPTHLLTSLLGTWPGLALWRWILLAVLIAGAYVAIRRFASLPTAAFLTAAISLSTVPLSYLANPYLTGAVLAGTSALIAAALFDSRRAAALAGLVMGWLVMVNPPGVLLAGVIWLTIRIHRRAVRITDLALTAAVTVAAFLVLLALGRWQFPELDWFASYLDAQQIRMSDFASKDPIWIKDISMLVPFAILVFAAVIWWSRRTSMPAQLGFAISACSVAFMLVFSPLMGGIALEAPMYQAMLWPPALIALGLTSASLVQPDPSAVQAPWSWSAIALGVVALIAIYLAGRWPGSIGLHKGQLLAVLMLAAAIAVALLLPRGRGVHATVIAAGVLLIGAQLLQNSRPSLGLYYLSPYNWAYNDNPIADKLHAAVDAQDWLLATTSRNDTILTWVDGDWVNGDRDLYVAAGMQLWGPNRIGLFSELDADDHARLESIQPSVIAMYGRSMEGVWAFMQGIPARAHASAPSCKIFSWPTGEPSVLQLCTTRLTWTLT